MTTQETLKWLIDSLDERIEANRAEFAARATTPEQRAYLLGYEDGNRSAADLLRRILNVRERTDA